MNRPPMNRSDGVGPTESMDRIRNMFMSPDRIPDPGPSASDYNQVVASAELAHLILVASEFVMKPNLHSIDLASEEQADLVLDHDVGSVSFDKEKGAVSGVFRWIVAIREKSAKPGDEAFFASASYYIAYDGIKPTEDERAPKCFLEKVGKFATYPYFRTHVSHLSWASGAEIPLLPVLRS